MSRAKRGQPTEEPLRGGGTDVYVEVVVDVPVRRYFTYEIPEHLLAKVEVGSRLYVPFQKRPRAALAMALRALPPDPKIRIENVIDVLDPGPVVPESVVAILEWTSRYYFAPPGEVMRLILPKPLRVRGKRSVAITDFGRQCLASDLVQDSVSQRALARLESSRRMQDKALRKAVRGLTYAKLDDLADKGLISLAWDRVDASKGKKTVRLLKRTGNQESGQRIGVRQQAVLDLLEGRGYVPAKEIRDLAGASAATVRTLITRGWVTERTEERFRDPFRDEEVPPPHTFTLTEEQQDAVQAIVGDGRFDRFRSFLLHGITGSGKTAVYIDCIKAVVAAQKQGLVLLPEIALTPQFVAIFRAHFGERVAVLHSGLTDGERFDQWRRIRNAEIDVVIGARSAVFAPLEQVGIVIVDEEHDGSFKQDHGVRYHARDLALVRGQQSGATVVLGSATPSLESLQRCRDGRCERLVLADRPTGQPLPEVEVVDMRTVARDEHGAIPLISPALERELIQTAAAGQQAILFLNRRGHSTSVLCRECGGSWECPHCEITLTFHRRPSCLKCHYCDYHEPLPEVCPTCESPEWMFFGAGTEKVSDKIPASIEGVRILRLDRDTAVGRNLRQIISDFREKRADVLVGTQMVTKGHDFPHVTLVGVLMADLSLRIPDFRSGERTFQLLAQVSGRAGRRNEKGKVIVQSFLPDHPVLRAAATQDYDTFAEAELDARRKLGYPPFGHLIVLRFEGSVLAELNKVTRRYQDAAERTLHAEDGWAGEVNVLGPVEAPLARLKDQFRWQMLIRSSQRSTLRRYVGQLLNAAGYRSDERNKVHVFVDVDPLHLM